MTFATAAAPNEKITETLFPERHKITLPLNSLNNYFQSCEIAFNHHTKLDCDRLVQLKMFLTVCVCVTIKTIPIAQKLLFGF